MDFAAYLSLINKKKQTILSVLILFILIAVILTFSQPFQYQAQASLLVVRDYTPGVDPYQISKSNEYVAKVLAKVVNSNSFYSEILNAGFNINRNYFTEDLKEQRKVWRKTVKAGVVADSGVIELAVFHPEKSQADQILRAVNATLKANHAQYHGAGDAIALNVIDQPFTSSYPVKPNIPVNMLLAVMFGLVFSLSYIYLFPDKRFDLRLWPSRRQTRIAKEDVYYGDGQESSAGVQAEIAAARAKLRQGLKAFKPGSVREVEMATSRVKPGTPDGNYSFYYHKDANQTEYTADSNFTAQDELGYEDVVKSGRMDNVIGS